MDSAAVRERITEQLRADPSATVEELLHYWDLPGGISIRPTGRLQVAPAVTGKDRYYRQREKEDGPPSPYRVRCWQQMREAERAVDRLRPEQWRSIRELLTLDRMRDAGRAYMRRVETLGELLDPKDKHEEKLLAALVSGTADDGPITPWLGEKLLLFGSYVWFCCFVQGRPGVVGTLSELAALLGCCHRRACTVVALAQRKCLVKRVPQCRLHPEGFVDREGRRRSRRRHTNVYEPGDAMRIAWLRLDAGVTPPAVALRSSERAAAEPAQVESHAIPEGSREDRTTGDPTAGEELNLGGTWAPPRRSAGPISGPPAPARPPRAPAAPPRCEAPPAPPVVPAEVLPAQGDASASNRGTTAPLSAGDRGTARGPSAASQQLPPEAPDVAGDHAAPAELIAPACKDHASDGKRPRAPAAAGRPVISPAQAAQLPDWFTRELSAAMMAPEPRRAGDALLARAQLWLDLTARGAPTAEADAAVERLRGEQQQRQGGPGPGAVCCPQRGDP